MCTVTDSLSEAGVYGERGLVVERKMPHKATKLLAAFHPTRGRSTGMPGQASSSCCFGPQETAETGSGVVLVPCIAARDVTRVMHTGASPILCSRNESLGFLQLQSRSFAKESQPTRRRQTQDLVFENFEKYRGPKGQSARSAGVRHRENAVSKAKSGCTALRLWRLPPVSAANVTVINNSGAGTVGFDGPPLPECSGVRNH